MEFTGEQFIPNLGKKRLIGEHLERYKYAKQFSKDRTVLDIACGTGYGAGMLSEYAKKVIGVDISRESIDYANYNYKSKNLLFINDSATSVLFEREKFDLICSFETIEHLEEEDRKKYLSNLNKWLKDDGFLLLSTPNKKITSPYTDKPVNKYHVLEYTEDLLRKEVSAFFEIEEILGQRLIKKYLLNFFIRKSIHFFAKLLKKKVFMYTEASSAEVASYNNKKYEPRIFVVKAKK